MERREVLVFILIVLLGLVYTSHCSRISNQDVDNRLTADSSQKRYSIDTDIRLPEETEIKPEFQVLPVNNASKIVSCTLVSDENLPLPGQTTNSGSTKDSGFNFYRKRLIRGSKTAETITKKQYLQTDWCRTEAFQQIIHEPGCSRKHVLNHFCYGQCNSFFIPKSDEEDQDGGSFKSCSYCTPTESEWISVILSCPNRTPRRIIKRIQIIKKCKCMANSYSNFASLLGNFP